MDWVLDDIRDTAVDSPRRSDDVAGWGVVGVVGVSVSGGGGGVVVVVGGGGFGKTTVDNRVRRRGIGRGIGMQRQGRPMSRLQRRQRGRWLVLLFLAKTEERHLVARRGEEVGGREQRKKR